MLLTVLATEAGPTAVILAVLTLPLVPAMILLPLLGIMLNGTSSVLYGTVPELAPPGHEARAFALSYTGTIGSIRLAHSRPRALAVTTRTAAPGIGEALGIGALQRSRDGARRVDAEPGPAVVTVFRDDGTRNLAERRRAERSLGGLARSGAFASR